MVGINVDNFRLAGDARLQCKLHLDVGTVSIDVLVVIEAIQFQSNVNVSTSMCMSM